MLPSPRWPNGSGRAPGMSLITAASASRMKAGTFATGTEMSCLIEPPTWRCTSPNISRMRQNALVCSSESAIAASATSPRSTPSARIASIVSRRPSRACEDSSISTYQGCTVVQRIARAAVVLQHRVDAEPHHQLERRDAAAACARSRCRAARARPPARRRRRTRSRPSAGAGSGASVAAVMTPSVPSAPMNRFFRS